jgi:site-specific recombinase XerD
MEMGEREVNQFLTELAVNKKVSASTQNQALSALVFLYRQVLNQPLLRLEELVRAKEPKRLPTVMTKPEVRVVLGRLEGTPKLIGLLLYGTGMRLMECLRLRVKDIDFALTEVIIRDGKGQKDRVTLLPATVKERLQEHLKEVRRLHEKDLAEGFGSVFLPDALARKTRAPSGSGAGNMCFRHPCGVEMRVAAQFGDIISMSRSFNGRSKRRFAGRA